MFGGINDKSIFITQILTHILFTPQAITTKTHIFYTATSFFGEIETVINLKKNAKIVNDKFYSQLKTCKKNTMGRNLLSCSNLNMRALKQGMKLTSKSIKKMQK